MDTGQIAGVGNTQVNCLGAAGFYSPREIEKAKISEKIDFHDLANDKAFPGFLLIFAKVVIVAAVVTSPGLNIFH